MAVTSTTASPPPPLDETTTAAIRQALGAAQMGRIAEACRDGRACARQRRRPDRAERTARCSRIGNDEHEAAIRHLEIAHAGRPADPRIALNLATALAKAGQMDRALAAASPNIALADPSLPARAPPRLSCRISCLGSTRPLRHTSTSSDPRRRTGQAGTISAMRDWRLAISSGELRTSSARFRWNQTRRRHA